MKRWFMPSTCAAQQSNWRRMNIGSIVDTSGRCSVKPGSKVEFPQCDLTSPVADSERRLNANIQNDEY